MVKRSMPGGMKLRILPGLNPSGTSLRWSRTTNSECTALGRPSANERREERMSSPAATMLSECWEKNRENERNNGDLEGGR